MTTYSKWTSNNTFLPKVGYSFFVRRSPLLAKEDIGGGGGAVAASGNIIHTLSDYSAIVSGHNNMIGDAGGVNAATFSFIGGGAANRIDATGANSAYNVVGGGYNNFIAAGTAYSSILGGNNNTITAGYPNTFIAGSNITVGPAAGNGIANALNVNGLWANGFPTWTTGPVPKAGTIFIVPIGTTPLPAGIQGQLFIS